MDLNWGFIIGMAFTCLVWVGFFAYMGGHF